MTNSLTPARLLTGPIALIVIGVFFGLLFGLFGGVLVGVSQQDFSSYTEHTTATITHVQVRTDGTNRRTRTNTYLYYADFEADGTTFTDRRLNGTFSGRLDVGDTVTLVYPPGEPTKAVTKQTTSASARNVELWIGVGLLVLAAGLLVGVAIGTVKWRARVRARGQAAERSLA
jgi:hypothetical protein